MRPGAAGAKEETSSRSDRRLGGRGQPPKPWVISHGDTQLDFPRATSVGLKETSGQSDPR